MAHKDRRLAAAQFHFDGGQNKTAAQHRLAAGNAQRNRKAGDRRRKQRGGRAPARSGAPRRAVGLVSGSNTSGEEPLLSDLYYLERALSPYADLHQGTISETCCHANFGSDARRYRQDRRRRSRQRRQIRGERRPADPLCRRTHGKRLRRSGAGEAAQRRALSRRRARLGRRRSIWRRFPMPVPLAGLHIPGDVTVSRQILAEPSVELSSHLGRGSPTARRWSRRRGAARAGSCCSM